MGRAAFGFSTRMCGTQGRKTASISEAVYGDQGCWNTVRGQRKMD